MIMRACLCLLTAWMSFLSAEDTAPTPPPAPAPLVAPAVLTPPTAAEIAACATVRGAIISTPRGEIRVTLFPKTTPVTVANFVKLAKMGFYNGTTFHRVVPGFVIQGGDPNTRTGQGAAGMGGPGYAIKGEAGPSNPERHEPGSLAMADSGLDTAGSQFYLTQAATHQLDGRYTVFGRISDPATMAIIQAVRIGDRMSVTIIDGEPQ